MLNRRLLGVLKQYGPEVTILTGEVLLRPGGLFKVDVSDAPRLGAISPEAARRRLPEYSRGLHQYGTRLRTTPSSGDAFWTFNCRRYPDLAAADAEPDWKKRLEMCLIAGVWPVECIYLSEAKIGHLPEYNQNEWRGDLALQRRVAPLVPWVARAAHRFWRRPRRDIEVLDGFLALSLLSQQLSDVVDWWEARRPADLMRLTPLEVLYRVRRWERLVSRTAVAPKHRPESSVVHEEDGYRVERLETPAALAYEGRSMQHCVAAYAGAVARKECEVYAVVDAAGASQATVEVTFVPVAGRRAAAEKRETETLRSHRLDLVRWAAQVKGRRNAEVTDRRVIAVLRSFFGKKQILWRTTVFRIHEERSPLPDVGTDLAARIRQAGGQ